MNVHQISTKDIGKPFTIQHRVISCFCGDLRGQCLCFSPKSHTVFTDSTFNDGSSITERPSISKSIEILVERSPVTALVGGDSENINEKTVEEIEMSLPQIDISLKPVPNAT